MAKTKEELNQLKQEYETLTNKLKELSEDELMIVTGGIEYTIKDKTPDYEFSYYKGKLSDFRFKIK